MKFRLQIRTVGQVSAADLTIDDLKDQTEVDQVVQALKLVGGVMGVFNPDPRLPETRKETKQKLVLGKPWSTYPTDTLITADHIQFCDGSEAKRRSDHWEVTAWSGHLSGTESYSFCQAQGEP